MDNRVDHANPYTNQIFQEAVIRNDFAVVKLLLKYGIYPRRNERNRQGLTALQQSVLDGNGKMSILLLEAGADIEAKTSNGWTCLHIASALGDLDILTTMINHCADLIALTKNEELPIDLAATRDIKIKLAKEMSRVGYSELAQWYMRKLAAREGVFYVSISADRLLDLACDDHYDKSYSDAYPYYMTHSNNEQEIFVPSPSRHASSPARQSQNNSLWPQDGTEQQQKSNIWLEISESTNTKYLTYSNGYEEVIESPLSEQARVRKATSKSSTLESPSRKATDSTRSVGSISEDNEGGTLPRVYSSTLRKDTSMKRQTNMQRKPSKIELHIDYTNSTEDDDDDTDEDDNNTITPSHSAAGKESENVYFKSPAGVEINQTAYQLSPGKSETQGENYSKTGALPGQQSTNDNSNDSPDHQRNRNVRFNTVDSSNEFCNCPNCKKMGYAFSPDITASSRKLIHVRQQMNLSPDKSIPFEIVPAGYMHSPTSSYIRSQYYPATTTGKHGIPIGSDGDYKPRKRKKKLFSGIRSMFKDSIRVHRTNDEPVTEDAGILFAVSLRDRSKAKTIQQRHIVRKSNSFSGSRNEYITEEVSVYPHNYVVPPPHGFADSAGGNKHHYSEGVDDADDDVFESKWVEYRHNSVNGADTYHPASYDSTTNRLPPTDNEHHPFEQYEKEFYCPYDRNDDDGIIYKVKSSETKQISLSEGSEYHYLEEAI